MKLTHLLFFLIIPTFLSAQKLERNEVDKFTKSRVAITAQDRLTNLISYKWMGQKDGDDINVVLVLYVFSGRTVFSIDSGDKAMILLQDGAVAQGVSDEFEISKKGYGRSFAEGSETLGVRIPYLFEDFDWVSSDNPPTEVRVYTSKGYRDSKINKNNAATFIAAYNLLVNSLAE